MNAALAGRVGPVLVSDSEAERKQQFRQLYQRWAPSVLGYALRRSADPQDAADVCAETFVVAWRRFDHIPGDAEALPWLYTVAANVLNNHRRGQ